MRFLKEDIQMAKDHEKVLIFIISEEYMKTEMYYHCH